MFGEHHAELIRGPPWKSRISRHFPDGRYWARTSDLLLVRRLIERARSSVPTGDFAHSGGVLAVCELSPFAGDARRFRQTDRPDCQLPEARR